MTAPDPSPTPIHYFLYTRAVSVITMSSDAERAAAVVALAWTTGGYASFIPYLLVHVQAVYMMFIDGSILCTVCAHMLKYRYEMHTVFAMFTVYSWIRLFEKVLIFPT